MLLVWMEKKKIFFLKKRNYKKVLETNFYGHLEIVKNFINFSKVKKKFLTFLVMLLYTVVKIYLLMLLLNLHLKMY